MIVCSFILSGTFASNFSLGFCSLFSVGGSVDITAFIPCCDSLERLHTQTLTPATYTPGVSCDDVADCDNGTCGMLTLV